LESQVEEAKRKTFDNFQNGMRQISFLMLAALLLNFTPNWFYIPTAIWLMGLSFIWLKREITRGWKEVKDDLHW